jgi:hypothetical protein
MTLTEKDIEQYGKSVSKQPFDHELAQLDFAYLENISDDELVYIHGIAEMVLKQRGILREEKFET